MDNNYYMIIFKFVVLDVFNIEFIVIKFGEYIKI